MHRHVLFAVGLSTAVLPVSDANAAFLTGAYVISTQADGNNTTSGQGAWDTVGGNGIWNIWLNSGGLGGPFVNGPTDAGAGLNLSLTPGVHDFTFQFRGGDIGVTYFGLNLFMDGNALAPAISTYGRINTTAAGNQAFFANSAAQTPALDGTVVPGAGTLTYVVGSQSVTLTDFQIFLPSVFNQDRVTDFSTTPDGHPNDEFVGRFSLTVAGEMTIVPEPYTLVLAGLSVVAFAGCACQKRMLAAA